MEFYTHGSFLCLDGLARKSGLKHSNVKVCITCCDRELLSGLLKIIAQESDCYFVKLSSQTKDGMFLGRCFFTTKEKAGQIWATYRVHPRLMVNLQDDDFADQFRKRE